ncbi:hypothetical protein B932_3448 [Gluconobacter oxydans H24]|nr:hypothetical protein B932_3448 [Gluconobacter oxydans H24]
MQLQQASADRMIRSEKTDGCKILGLVFGHIRKIRSRAGSGVKSMRAKRK